VGHTRSQLQWFTLPLDSPLPPEPEPTSSSGAQEQTYATIETAPPLALIFSSARRET